MMTLPFRRIAGAALVAGAAAAASWAVRNYLDSRRLHGQRAADRDMLQTWENEGGTPIPAGAYVPNATAP
jgi:hypothetical protein